MSGARFESAGPTDVIRATVTIPLHNRERYIGPLLESLFAQWRAGLEVLLIDDGSTDASFAVIQQVLERWPRIPATLARLDRPHGMALPREIVRLARGSVFIRADSDDIALPGRLDAILARFDEDADCRLVTSNAVLLTPESLCCGLYDTRTADAILRDPAVAAERAGDPRWLGATMAFHRDLYERFPAIEAELCPYGLDLILPLRALLLGSHHYIAQPLVGWRQHGSNAHRAAGAFGDDPCAQEQYQALLLMALAQKIRDVEHLRASVPDEVLEHCRSVFHVKFDLWSRLRARCTAAARSSNARGSTEAFKPAVAAIAPLRLGEPLRFACGQDGTRYISHSAGFHDPEPWGVWTERVAHLNLRIEADPGTAIRLVLDTFFLPQRFTVGIVGQGRVDCLWFDEIDTDQTFVALPAITVRPVVGIIILVRETFVPSSTMPGSPDERMLGLSLSSITAIADDPTLDAA